jgi:hypothetical protein
MGLLFIIPIAMIGSGTAGPKGDAGQLAVFGLYGSPVAALLFLLLGSQRKEGMKTLRMVFIVLYALWLIGSGALLVVGALFGTGDNW